MNGFDQIHRINRLLLEEVDRICRKNGISYCMDGGTLIGAVRHHGSIPWDDDVDITMTRENYNRFLEVAPDELRDGYELVKPSDMGQNHFFDYVTRVAYVNSHVLADDAEMDFYGHGKLNRILLDIFVLDEISDNPLAQKLQIWRMKFLYGLSWGYRYRIDYSKYTGLQRIGVFLLAHLGRLSSQRDLEEKHAREAMRFNGKGCHHYYSAYYIFEEMHLIYKKSWFAKTVDLEYEGCQFMAPVGYDQVLTMMFGDYMQLPPEEEREPKHFSPDDPYFRIDE